MSSECIITVCVSDSNCVGWGCTASLRSGDVLGNQGGAYTPVPHGEGPLLFCIMGLEQGVSWPGCWRSNNCHAAVTSCPLHFLGKQTELCLSQSLSVNVVHCVPVVTKGTRALCMGLVPASGQLRLNWLPLVPKPDTFSESEIRPPCHHLYFNDRYHLP